MRNTIVSLYQPSHLTSLIPTMHNFITSATHRLDSESQDIVISNLFLELTTNIIGQAAFGVDFGLSSKTQIKDSADSNVYVTDFINQHVYSTTQLKMDLSGSLHNHSLTDSDSSRTIQAGIEAEMIQDRRCSQA